MAYSQIEQRYMDMIVEGYFPTTPPEPAPEEPSLEGVQLAAGPSKTRTDAPAGAGLPKAPTTPEQAAEMMRNMPLATQSEMIMRRIAEDQKAGVVGSVIPKDMTLREKLASGMQQMLIDNAGMDNVRARRLAQTMFGGESSGAPLGIGLVDVTPFVIPLAAQEAGISAGEAREAAQAGEYGQAALSYGTGVLQGLDVVPGVAIAAKVGKAAGEALAPAAGELFSNYANRTGLVQYVADPNRVFANYSGEYIQPTRRLKTLVDKLESGSISEQSYIEETKTLSSQMKERATKVTSEDKVRGADEVTRRLLGALNPNAQIQLKEETVRFAKWLLDNNPQFANDLGISIKSGGVKGTAGGYTSLDMVATIFADKANPGTGVHEILHHTEQMMPVAVQNGILDEWTKSYLNAYRTADPKVQAYLKQIPDAISGKPLAKNLIMEGFKRGVLDYDTHYQLVNPSEYWAVNATRIMNSRYEAGSWVGKAKVWLNEFAEKAKGAFGLPSDSPVLKGIKDITKGSGQLQSEMLTEPENVSSSAARVKVQKKKTEQRKQVAKGAAVTGVGLSLAGDEE